MLTKKFSAQALLFCLCLVVPVALVFSVDLVSGATVIQVPSPQYPTIQSALNASTNGTTINIAAGTYNEDVYVGKSLSYLNDVTFQGVGANTVINGNVTVAGMHYLKMGGFKINGNLQVGVGMGGDVQNSTFSDLTVQNVTFLNAQSVAFSNSHVNHLTLMVYAMGGGDTLVTVQNNIVTGGIAMENSMYNTIIGNTISGSDIGIDDNYPTYVSWHSGAGNNLILGNTIINCKIGLNLRSGQMYTNPDTIIQNTIKENNIGIQLAFNQAPVIVQNIFSQNNLQNNQIQVNCTGEGSDVWSAGVPLRGNYWSDYKGKDANGDGLGDAQYNINPDNKDSYPLMYPYGTTPPTPTPTASSLPTAPATVIPTINPTPPNTPTITPTTTPSSNPTLNPTSNSTSQNQNVIPETNIYWLGLLMLLAGVSAVFLTRKSIANKPL
jgi:hypothetical protein